MTAVALRAEGRVVTHCCGGHHPGPGEASTCLCCPACVTNVFTSRYSPEARRAVARGVRCAELPGLLRLRDVYRRVEHALAVEEMWAPELDEVRHLADALRHATQLPTGDYPTVQGVLT